MSDTQLTTTSILALFETNKEQRADFIEKTVEAIENGEVSALNIHLQIKAMEEIIAGITSLDEKKNKNVELAKRYRAILLNEAEQNGKSFQYHNAKVDIKEVGTKYDYSACNDSELKLLEDAANAAMEALKARQKFLQNIPEQGIEQLDHETGEMVTVYRPTKTSTTSVTVSLK